MNEEVKNWLVPKLESWNLTFDETEYSEDGEPIEPTTSLDLILPRLKADKQLTPQEYEEILFHLWQIHF